MDDWSVGFKFYLLAIAYITELRPSVLVDLRADIDVVEVWKDPFVGIKASVDIEFVLEYYSCMTCSGWYIFTFDFDLCPSGVEWVF